MCHGESISILDGHNDTIKNMYLSQRSFFVRSDRGHIDFPRARQGGMKGGFFAILIIPESLEERKFGYGLNITENGWEVAYPGPLKPHYAVQFTNQLIEFILELTKKSQEIKIVQNYKELQHCIGQDILSIILHFEGAEAIAGNLSNLEYYYEKGLRSLGLVWSRPNVFGYGVPFKFPCDPDTGPGLTKAGKELVRKCNDLGIIIDLAHINKKGFFDVTEMSIAPLVASHAGVHSICQSSTNLTDSQIDAVGDSGGVIGVIFDILNTRPDGKLVTDTSLSIIVQHIDYIVNRIGIDHVALGSDFDGGQLPIGLKDIAGLPKLINTLREYDYSNENIEKIAYKNWLRVIKETWK